MIWERGSVVQAWCAGVSRRRRATCARRLLRKRQTKDFASHVWCVRRCRLGSGSLAAARAAELRACGGHRGGTHSTLPALPAAARGRLSIEKPRRRRHPREQGRRRGDAQAHGQPRVEGVASLGARIVWGTGCARLRAAVAV